MTTKNYNKVALIDDNAAQNLFPSQNPVGQTVEINQEPYTIVGVIRQDENYQPTINSIDEYYTLLSVDCRKCNDSGQLLADFLLNLMFLRM